MVFNYKKTNKVALHYTFGQCDSITVPSEWRYSASHQRQAIQFYKLYESHRYMRDCIKSGDVNLINYSKNIFNEELDKSLTILTDPIFKESYPQIFNKQN